MKKIECTPLQYLIVVPIILTLSAMTHTDVMVATADTYPTMSVVDVRSKNTDSCYRIMTQFDNTEKNRTSTLLERIACSDNMSSQDSVWDSVYIPSTDSTEEQCFETIVLQQEVFSGHEYLKIEVTGMTKVSCAELPIE